MKICGQDSHDAVYGTVFCLVNMVKMLRVAQNGEHFSSSRGVTSLRERSLAIDLLPLTPPTHKYQPCIQYTIQA